MKKGLNGFQLKVIACILMVIDHVGVLFFPDMIIFRIIGRLAFPIFAFFISEGFFHTRSVRKYLTRLGVCAVLFQVPDWFSRIYSFLYNVPGFGIRYKFNIFATLFLGLLGIALFDRLKGEKSWLSWTAVIAAAILAEITDADYGAYGVLYIMVFYLSHGNIENMLLGSLALHAAYAVYGFLVNLRNPGTALTANSLQLYSLSAVPLLALYNRERGRNAKYVFYVFYPVHMIVLYIIYCIM